MHFLSRSSDRSRVTASGSRASLAAALVLGALFSISAGLDAAPERILLGPSDGFALDQPRLSFEVFDDGGFSLGPTITNTLLLDTGAERILVVSYIRNSASGALTFVLEESAGLSSWTPVSATPVVEPINSVTERVAYELDAHTAGPFFRLSMIGGTPTP